MAFTNLVVQVKSAIRGTADGISLNLQGTRDGAGYFADYITKLGYEGRILTGITGSAATPSTFAVGYTSTQPSLEVDIPAGTTVIPIHIAVFLRASAGTLTEVLAVTSTNLVGAGTSTSVTPLSTRTDAPFTTATTVRSLYSGAGTAPTGGIEFWHTGYPFADATGAPVKMFEWDYRAQPPYFIVGVGSLAIYVQGTGTAPTGFAKVTWAEVPSTQLV